jgi:hypothetical protein
MLAKKIIGTSTKEPNQHWRQSQSGFSKGGASIREDQDYNK